MFPITHIWFSERVLGYRNSMTVLGAIFPDIVITKCLDYDHTHNCGWELYDYLTGACSGCGDFARGMITHTVNPKGLDYYGDESYGSGYKGYCFQKGSAVADEVIAACNLPEEFGLWKAHNFIEMGIEINIAESNQQLAGALHEALGDHNAIKTAASGLERYFELDENILANAIKSFTKFIDFSETNSRSLAYKYYAQTQVKHGLAIDIDESARIIEKCRGLVQEDFDGFIGFCTAKVHEMIEVKNGER